MWLRKKDNLYTATVGLPLNSCFPSVSAQTAVQIRSYTPCTPTEAVVLLPSDVFSIKSNRICSIAPSLPPLVLQEHPVLMQRARERRVTGEVPQMRAGPDKAVTSQSEHRSTFVWQLHKRRRESPIFQFLWIS